MKPLNSQALQKHALRLHPGSSFDPPYNGFTLACTRYEEAVSTSLGIYLIDFIYVDVGHV